MTRIAPKVVAEGRFLRFLIKQGWEYVERPNCTGIVIIVAVTDEGKLLFTEQFRLPVGRPVIEFPAGLVGDEGPETIEAARGVTRQAILGVNSDPDRSVGSFCRATAADFEQVLEQLLDGGVRTQPVHRLQLVMNGQPLRFSVLNDLLVAHRNPAAMSRYELGLDAEPEEQRSSGLWIATAAGSTAAIKSAGGQVLLRDSQAIQYLPRELYRPAGVTYRLTGGVVPAGQAIVLRSLMREGMIFADGEHLRIPFRYGDQLEITTSPFPLCLVQDGASPGARSTARQTPRVRRRQSEAAQTT